MDFKCSKGLLLLAYLWTFFSSLFGQGKASQLALPLLGRQIHQFQNPTYLHDIYVASNGNILITSVIPQASIYLVSESTTPMPIVSLVHTFDSINFVTGIVETQPDVFAFVGGNQSRLGVGANGTFGIWELDLRTTRPLIQKIVHIPESGYLLSTEILPNEPTSILVSDGARSLVWKVDTLTRQYQVAIQDPNMQFPRWGFSPQGIDGIRVYDNYLYWSNSYIASIYRIPITCRGVAVAGAKSELVKEITSVFIDKFAIGPRDKGIIWATTNEGNRLFAITPDGKDAVVAGAPDQMTLAGCTAAVFGKLQNDTNTLYVVTAGGLGLPINGTMTEGGKLIAFDTSGFVDK